MVFVKLIFLWYGARGVWKANTSAMFLYLLFLFFWIYYRYVIWQHLWQTCSVIPKSNRYYLLHQCLRKNRRGKSFAYFCSEGGGEGQTLLKCNLRNIWITPDMILYIFICRAVGTWQLSPSRLKNTMCNIVHRCFLDCTIHSVEKETYEEYSFVLNSLLLYIAIIIIKI